MVDKYEKASAKPVSVENMTSSYIERQMQAIVGFEIEIKSIEASYKLSQNRDAENHKNVISELEKRGDANSIAIADEMKKHPYKKA
jgi:transcriptional regulator